MLNIGLHEHGISRPATWQKLKKLGIASILATLLVSVVPAHGQSSSSSTADTAQQPAAASGTADSRNKGSLLTKQKELDAQRERGERLIDGWNTTPDKTEGLKLLESAIEQGDRKSLIVLGRLYMDGRFLKRDRRRALQLFERAAKMGDYEGIEAFGEDRMWNAKTTDDKREAERLLSMAGTSGRGSAWATLGYGAIYRRLTPAANARFETYLRNARALGNNQIEIVEAERLLYRTGKRGNPAAAIRSLEAAADEGNPDAIKYLIRLVRNGNDYTVKPSLSRARAYLNKYGPKLPPKAQEQQALLLRAATARRATEFATLSHTVRARDDFKSADFQRQIYQANSNFSIYLAQLTLKEKNLYRGPLNGRATSRTMASLRGVCKTLVWKSNCDKKILSDRAMAAIIVN